MVLRSQYCDTTVFVLVLPPDEPPLFLGLVIAGAGGSCVGGGLVAFVHCEGMSVLHLKTYLLTATTSQTPPPGHAVSVICPASIS